MHRFNSVARWEYDLLSLSMVVRDVVCLNMLVAVGHIVEGEITRCRETKRSPESLCNWKKSGIYDLSAAGYACAHATVRKLCLHRVGRELLQELETLFRCQHC
jgi:hypothetical protein